jgi:predicted transcriptional regulator
VTSQNEDLLRFIGSSFRSVWALELLLLLKREKGDRSRDELVTTLRASELVVAQAVDSLVVAGLVSIEGESVRYLPATDDIAKHMNQVEKLYAARPDAVRRAIVSATASGATAFADAFKLRKD